MIVHLRILNKFLFFMQDNIMISALIAVTVILIYKLTTHSTGMIFVRVRT